MVVVGLLVAGCLESGVTRCAWGLYCGADSVCSEAIKKCVFPVQLQVCHKEPDGANNACESIKDRGECYEGVCAEPQCGDGLKFASEECDDGNRVDNDGCSSGCVLEKVRWRRLELSMSPPPRAFAALAYDPETEQVTLFGGGDGSTQTLGDTWTLQLKHDAWPPPPTAWVQAATPQAPTKRQLHAMVFDTREKKTLLFGGLAYTQKEVPLDDTWLFDGITWEEISDVAGRHQRYRHSLVWDEHREQAVLFGGKSSSADVAELWVFDSAGQVWHNKGWTQDSPNPRGTAAMVLDAAANRIVLAGGVSYTGAPGVMGKCYPETWELALGSLTWKQLAGIALSPCLRSAAGAFEHRGGLVVLFGGESDDGGKVGAPLQETWVLRSQGWESGARKGVEQPPPRKGHAMVSLGKKGGVLLFGGIDASGKLLDDTWVGRVDTDRCGNGNVDEEEGCDGQVFAKDQKGNQLDCQALGYSGGKLTCESCRVDTSSCTK